MNQNHLCRGLSKIFWAYILLALNFNLGSLNVLPDWVGYVLLWQALGLLGEELRNLSLLKPFCMALGWWEGAVWGCALFGFSLSGRFYLLDLVLALFSIYFHFQLLTDLALLADGLEPQAGPPLGPGLRRCRNWDAVLRTLAFFLALWAPDTSSGVAQILVGILIVAQLAVLIVKLRQIAALKGRILQGDEEAPAP